MSDPDKTEAPKRKRGWTGNRGGDCALTDEVRKEIVTRLACYDQPAAIHKDLVARGIDVSVMAVWQYHPEHASAARALAQRWVDLFWSARETFLQGIAAEPIANRAYRLRKLDEARAAAMEEKDYDTARKVLEAAAKEVGNVFTNIQKVQGSVLPGQVAAERTPEENRIILADRLREAVERLPKKAAAKPATLN